MKVLLGMSGGVDSSMAAFLLAAEGYEVIGAHMQLWQDQIDENKNEEDWDNMFLVADKLKIPIYELDFKTEFKNSVIDYFLKSHQAGITPNPCIICNLQIKFGLFMEKMTELNCDYIATGHYIKLVNQNNHIYLQAGTDKTKDQSYFLYHLQQTQLQKILFPLGDKNKSDIKQMAKDYGLVNIATRKESQGVCFFPEDSYIPFLKKNIPEIFQSGEIVYHGKVIGMHQGLPHYTIGQRRGIDVGGFPEPIYTIAFDYAKNILIMGDDHELFHNTLIAHSFVLTGTNDFQSDFIKIANQVLLSRIRHLGKLIACKIKLIPPLNDQKNHQKKWIEVNFLEPIRAITPGQTITFYDTEENVIGGGEIYQ